ncbi:nucleotidyltransferase family protein [Microvirga sp. W0021]|uniref:Nucleotidyltransferase family protein n=1 Tax=Hohaiivirga grylli TaxID=3133970 RepID=A0ABV0BI42_9HYPH
MASKKKETISPHKAVSRAMVLAAGLGKRMRPLTDTMPKPLVPVCGKSLIDYSLDRVAEAGITEVVVNVHYLADQLEEHLSHRKAPHITISDERGELLETAGGIKKAMPYLVAGQSQPEPFLILNSDELWIEGAHPNIERMLEHWNPEQMDILLLLASNVASIGYSGKGDFLMDTLGRLQRRPEGEMAAFVYAGVAIAKPELFDDIPAGPVSMNLLFDRAIAKERLYGLRLDGIWLHVGTVEAIAEAEACVEASTR